MIRFDPKTMPHPRCQHCGGDLFNVLGAPDDNPRGFYGQCRRCDGVVESLPLGTPNPMTRGVFTLPSGAVEK